MDCNLVSSINRLAPPSKEPPDSSSWPLESQLLANILDVLQWANWQRGGGKGQKPRSVVAANKRIARPDPGLDVREILSRAAPKQSDG